MPANLTPQYLEADVKFKQAKTTEEKIKAFEVMMAMTRAFDELETAGIGEHSVLGKERHLSRFAAGRNGPHEA